MIAIPLKAIRAKCLDCCCGSSDEVRICHIDRCTLHPFRFGKNPFRRVELSEAQRVALRVNGFKRRDAHAPLSRAQSPQGPCSGEVEQ